MSRNSARKYAVHAHGETFVALNELLDKALKKGTSFSFEAIASSREDLEEVRKGISNENNFFREGDLQVIGDRVIQVESTINHHVHILTNNLDRMPLHLRALRGVLIAAHTVHYTLFPKV